MWLMDGGECECEGEGACKAKQARQAAFVWLA